MYQKTSLWLIAILVSSVPQAYAGKPSTPSTQPSQPPVPANSPSPSPTPSPTPATPAQPSGTPSAADNNNQQPGFLSTPLGQATAVGGAIVTGVVGIGAAVELGEYVRKKSYQRKKAQEPQGQPFNPVEQDVVEPQVHALSEEYFKKLSASVLEELNALKGGDEHRGRIIKHLSSENPHVYNEAVIKDLEALKNLEGIPASLKGRLNQLQGHFMSFNNNILKPHLVKLYLANVSRALQGESGTSELNLLKQTIAKHAGSPEACKHKAEIVEALEKLNTHADAGGNLKLIKREIELLNNHYKTVEAFKPAKTG